MEVRYELSNSCKMSHTKQEQCKPNIYQRLKESSERYETMKIASRYFWSKKWERWFFYNNWKLSCGAIVYRTFDFPSHRCRAFVFLGHQANVQLASSFVVDVVKMLYTIVYLTNSPASVLCNSLMNTKLSYEDTNNHFCILLQWLQNLSLVGSDKTDQEKNGWGRKWSLKYRLINHIWNQGCTTH